jgi:hypothetical protein
MSPIFMKVSGSCIPALPRSPQASHTKLFRNRLLTTQSRVHQLLRTGEAGLADI